MNHLGKHWNIGNTRVSEKKILSCFLAVSHQLVPWRLGVDVLLVDVQEEEAEGCAGHDDQTTH